MDKDMQVDSDAEADAAASGFIFSRPNIVPSPEKTVNFGVFSDNVFGSKIAQQNEMSTFTFAKPDTIERIDHMEDADMFAGNASTGDFKSPFAPKNTEGTSVFGKSVQSNKDHKPLLPTQNVQANVFATSAKPSENPFTGPVAEQTNIFSASSQPAENYKSPFKNEEPEKGIFSSSSAKPKELPFGIQSGEQTNVFSTTAAPSFGTQNSEKTNVFVKSAKPNEDPFGVQATEKSNVFSTTAKSGDVFKSPFAVQQPSAFANSVEPSENAKPPLPTQTPKAEEPESSSPSSDARAPLRRSNASDSDSAFSARDLKKSEIFSRLEKNTKKNVDVKLELSKSITCTEVPDALLLKNEAKKHFEKFGETHKIIIKAKRKMITVYYATDNGALKAYNKAGTYEGQEFQTDWTTAEMLAPKPRKKESIKKKIASFLNIDDEVKEELEAMTGQPEYNMPGETAENLKTLAAAKAKLRKTKELTNKAITQKRAAPVVAKSLVKAAKTIAARPTAERRIPRREEPPSPVEPPTESRVIPKISLAAIEEMQNLIRQPGTTAEERYKILDARDRLMRLKRQKTKNLATAKLTEGTCPDMCPEKERYMREFQRQVFS